MIISNNDSGIFNVNVYIEMKTEFKIVVYFIAFHTAGKRVRTLVRTWCVHIYAKFIFFKIPTCAWKIAYAYFYAHTPGVRTSYLA